MTPLDTALAFVARINAHDIPGMVALMSPDHQFIDSLGTVIVGREKMEHSWQQYLKMVPDYCIEVSHSFTDRDQVVLLGLARGTYSREGRPDPLDAWQTPAAWRATVRNGLIGEWQVYADNEPIRQRIARASA